MHRPLDHSTVVTQLRNQFPRLDWRDDNNFLHGFSRIDGYAKTPIGEVEVFRVYFQESMEGIPGRFEVQFAKLDPPFKCFDSMSPAIEFMKSISDSLS